jgi:hypothetical protein
MTDPQQWNRYAYAGNSPLKYVDPSDLAYEGAVTHRDGTVQVFVFERDSEFWDWVSFNWFWTSGGGQSGDLLSFGGKIGEYRWFSNSPDDSREEQPQAQAMADLE